MDWDLAPILQNLWHDCCLTMNTGHWTPGWRPILNPGTSGCVEAVPSHQSHTAGTLRNIPPTSKHAASVNCVNVWLYSTVQCRHMLMLYCPFDNANALLSALDCLFQSVSEKILDFRYKWTPGRTSWTNCRMTSEWADSKNTCDQLSVVRWWTWLLGSPPAVV